MKKITSLLAAGCALLALFILNTGCMNEVIPDGGFKNGGRNTGGGVKLLFWSRFEGCGIQIWPESGDSFQLDQATGIITIGNVGWWGGNLGAYDGGVDTGTRYDLSKIAKVTFDAVASAEGDMYLKVADGDANVFTIGTTKKTFTATTIGTSSGPQILTLGGSTDGEKKKAHVAGDTITITNVAFYDASGKEIVPTVKN